MKPLTEWFTGMNIGGTALLLAVAAGLIVLLAFILIGRRHPPRDFRPPIPLPQSPVGSADWESPMPTARHDERRRSIRRTGLPTPILVVEAKSGRSGHASEAYVLDRSSGGLRLALEKPYSVGALLLARPGNAPEGFQWVKLVVKSCREVSDYFETGCQFESELELGRLLMFG
jgi:hypothetical protein